MKIFKTFAGSLTNPQKFEAPKRVPFVIKFFIKIKHFEASGDQGHFGGQDWSQFCDLKSHRALQMADSLLHSL